MKENFRSSCPIASTLDILGDRWTLLVVRDMLLGGKKTFKELIISEEGIATNTLSDRLKKLECFDILTKQKLPDNKKENIYLLTERGIELTPIILDIVLWSDKHLREFNPAIFDPAEKGLYQDRSLVITSIQKSYRKLVKDTLLTE